MPVNQGIYGVNPGRPTTSNWQVPNYAPPDSTPVYKPKKVKPPVAEEVGDPLRGPGSHNIDVTDPGAAVESAREESVDVFRGLQQFLFGTSQPDVKGDRGGLLGGIPVIGDLGRFGGEATSNLVGRTGDVLSGALNVAGGALEHASLGVSADLKEKYDSIPPDAILGYEEDGTPITRLQYDAKVAATGATKPGTGAFTPAAHYMADAIKRYKEKVDQTALTPSLYDNLFMENASLADTMTNMFGLLGLTQRVAERGWAGMATPGQGGRNRLQTIIDVGDGKIEFKEDEGLFGTGLLAGGGKGLNEVEQHVYDMYKSGAWNETEALDYLASHNAGISHAASMQILGTVAIDPLNVASLGAMAVAKLGKVGVQLVQMERVAQEALAAARASNNAKAIEAAEGALKMVQRGITSGDRVHAADALGQIGKLKPTGDLARSFGRFYEAMATNSVGKIAKGARVVIDPLHLYGDKPRVAKAIEEGSSVIAESIARTHGYANHGNLEFRLATLPGIGEQTVNDFRLGLSIYTGNVFRRVTAQRYLATQAWRGALRELREGGMQEGVMKGMQAALKNATKGTLARVDEEVSRFIKFNWTDADLENLARRSAKFVGGGMDEDQWLAFVSDMTVEQRSMLHASTYGLAVSRLHKAIEATVRGVSEGSMDWRLGFKPEDLILLNRTTLTDLGLRGIITRLDAAGGNLDAALAEIESAKRMYPELLNFVSDPTSGMATVEEFRKYLARIKPRLPHQIEYAERPNLPPPLRDFDEFITPNPEEGVFTLGFKPKEEFRWGIEEDATGALHVVGDPWYDQISDVNFTGLETFRGVRELSYNAAGSPLGPLASPTARVVDKIEQAGKTLFRGVTGSMVSDTAHKKFVARLSNRIASAGLPESAAEEVWKALAEHTREAESISGMRGLSKGSMWSAAREITRKWPSSAGYGPHELMMDVMYAWEGDLRTVGMTQLFTGRVKRMVAQYTDRNIAGQIGEHIWPLLKFRYNPMFQVQEKIEPWLLNAQRGARVSMGRQPDEIDRLTASIYKRYLETSLIAMSDQDIAELSAKFAFGSELEILSMDRASAIHNFTSKLSVDAILDVQGTKRLNMLRTFEKGLAKELRGTWDAHLPGRFDDMLAHARVTSGRFMSEDEFAVRMVAENLAANDVAVRTFLDAEGNVTGWMADFDNAIRTGWEAAPQHLGEIRPLDIGRMVQRMGLEGSDGFLIADEMGLRRALAAGRVTMEQVERELRDLGAHPEYIQRVRAAIRFNWNDFWMEVKSTYSLTDDELFRIKSFYGRAAAARGMSPVEYLSQVYSPNIAHDGAGGVGSLGAAVDVMRNGQVYRDVQLATLVAGDGTARALYAQMGRVAIAHMDPSGKAALIRGLIGTANDPGPLYGAAISPVMDSIDGIEDAIQNDAVADFLGGVLMDYFQGAPPTGPSISIALDADPALAFIRNDVTARLTAEGRPPRTGRFVVEDSIDIQREAATEIENMHVFYDVMTPEDARVVKVADVDVKSNEAVAMGVGGGGLKPHSKHLPQEVRQGYTAYVSEVRRLYRHIVDDLHIKVYSSGGVEPYATAAELRADLARVTASGRKAPRIKVRGDDNFHPVLTDEDMFMARVVHSVYGYGQEAVEFGADDSFFRTAQMFSQDARGTMLMDTWGQRQAALHSTKPYAAPTPAPRTVDEFDATFGAALPEHGVGTDRSVGGLSDFVSRRIGDRVRILPEPDQEEIVRNTATLTRQFPLSGDISVNVTTAQAYTQPGENLWSAPIAATFTDGKGRPPGIVFVEEQSGYLHDDLASGLAQRESRLKRWRDSQLVVEHEFRRTQGAVTTTYKPRTIGFAGSHVGASTTSDMFHEYGHVVDRYLHNLMDDARKAKIEARIDDLRAKDPTLTKTDARNIAEAENPYDDLGYVSDRFRDAHNRFRNTNIRYMVSGYANVPYSGSRVMKEGDLFAEVFDLAFNDEMEFTVWKAKLEAARSDPSSKRSTYYDPVYGENHVGYADPFFDSSDPLQRSVFIFPDGTINEELIDAIDEWREALRADGVWKPDAVPTTVGAANPDFVGKTVGEINRGFTAPPVGYARPLDAQQAILDGVVTADPDFYYHVTDDIPGIQSDGFVRATTPDYRGEQTLWPDGSILPRSYWSETPAGVLPYISENSGYQGIIRVRRNAAPFRVAAGEVVVDDVDIAKQHVEVLGPDMRWHPIDRAVEDTPVGGPGTIPVQPRYGKFSPGFTDRMMGHYLGRGRFSEANPDLARFAHFTRDTMADATESFFAQIGDDSAEMFADQPSAFSWGDIFGENSGLPDVKGVPFDYSQGLLWDAAVQSMASKWEDAFRLQYFAQNRSMLQRSINHPMFGLYPASYMWGKVGPELIKFLALEPFGLNTGAALRTLADVQMSIGMRRSYDEEFDARIEALGHSAALDFLSYLVPATPWSIPASYPSWMRAFSQQGLEWEAQQKAGLPLEDMDWTKPITSTVKRIIPALSYVPWMGRAVEEIDGRPDPGSPEYEVWLLEQIAKAQKEGRVPAPPAVQEPQLPNAIPPGGATPAGPQAAPAGGQPADLGGTVPATNLGPTLAEQMEALQRVLSQ